MIYHNGDRAVNLFKKHNAHQPVGPGHFAKRDELSGVFPGCGTMAVGAADQEREVLGALVEVTLQELGKGFAGHGFSAFIKYEGKGFWGQCSHQDFSFFVLALARGLALGFSEIADCQLCNSGLAAEAFKAGLIVLARVFSGPAFNFPMPRTWRRMAYSAAGSCGECSDHSFSRL